MDREWVLIVEPSLFTLSIKKFHSSLFLVCVPCFITMNLTSNCLFMFMIFNKVSKSQEWLISRYRVFQEEIRHEEISSHWNIHNVRFTWAVNILILWASTQIILSTSFPQISLSDIFKSYSSQFSDHLTREDTSHRLWFGVN